MRTHPTSSTPQLLLSRYHGSLPVYSHLFSDIFCMSFLTRFWFTFYDDEPYHLKKLVLRMYWDGEATPSVETPLGDFFGLGLGDYHVWESELLSVANERALNCFFLMPFQKHARLTVTNEGKQKVSSFYFNLDYRALAKPLPADT